MKKKYPKEYSRIKPKQSNTNAQVIFNEIAQKPIGGEPEYIVFKDAIRNKEVKIEKTLLEDLAPLCSPQGTNGESIELSEKLFEYILHKKYFNTIYQIVCCNDKDK